MRIACVSALLVATGLSVVHAQSTSPYAYRLGAVTVVVPPPRGFDDAFKIPEMRDRLPSTDTVEVLAAHLPADVVRSFKPGQDLDFYTRVFVLRAAKEQDMSADLIAEFAQRAKSGDVPDQRARLAEIEKQTGVAISQPLNLGVFDQTPTSFSAMQLTTVKAESGSANVLFSATSIVARRRFVVIQAMRRFNTTADKTALEDFTRTWVRAIIAANP